MPGGPAPGPLAGRTVVVTRSGPRARGLVDALQGAGAETIEVPLTEQAEAADGGAALRGAAAEVARYRWVVLTSVNAVHRFIGLRPRRPGVGLDPGGGSRTGHRRRPAPGRGRARSGTGRALGCGSGRRLPSGRSRTPAQPGPVSLCRPGAVHH